MLALHSEERIWLYEYRRALVEEWPGAVVRMLVYGSKARGDAHEDSDIDVLLVLRKVVSRHVMEWSAPLLIPPCP